MTPEKVIDIFKSWEEDGIRWVPASVLAKQLDLPDPRALRGTKHTPGPIEELNPKIMALTGRVVISNTAKGYKLTNDKNEIKYAVAQLRAHAYSTLARALRLERLIETMTLAEDLFRKEPEHA
jgi:hypothetical protein